MLHVLVKPSSPVLPYVKDEADLSVEDKEQFLKFCPIIDLREKQNKPQIFDFVRSMFAYYFQISPEYIKHDSNLIHDIEPQVWVKELGIPFNKGSQQGKIAETGILMASLFMYDLAMLTGVHVVEEDDEYTFVSDDVEFKHYYACNTVAELVDLFISSSIG